MQRKTSLKVLSSDAKGAASADTSQPVRSESAPLLAEQTISSPFFAAADPADRRLRFGTAASELPSFPEEGAVGRVATSQDAVVPVVTWGGAAAQGERAAMEDAHVGVADVAQLTGHSYDEPRSFFGLFDGHGGPHAAAYARDHLLDILVENECFSARPGEALDSLLKAFFGAWLQNSAFLDLDERFYSEVDTQPDKASGSTLLAALVWGSQLVVANAGDSRAVLCRRGRALALSTDHRPTLQTERERIAQRGGHVCQDGFLNGQLGVSRAMGDYHLEGLKVKSSTSSVLQGPLTAEPQISISSLMAEDEFLLLACDGLWDVLSSQRAVELARQCLQRNQNNPTVCAQMLVDTSLRMHASDNVTVLVVCLAANAPPRREYGARDKVRRSFSQNGLDTLKSLLED